MYIKYKELSIQLLWHTQMEHPIVYARGGGDWVHHITCTAQPTGSSFTFALIMSYRVMEYRASENVTLVCNTKIIYSAFATLFLFGVSAFDTECFSKFAQFNGPDCSTYKQSVISRVSSALHCIQFIHWSRELCIQDG